MSSINDPIEIGLRMTVPIMQAIYAYAKDPSLHESPEALAKIGMMIDCLVGSAQVHAVEKGLDATPEMYRLAIAEKLAKL